MPRPLIGIPPCVDTRDRWRAGRVYVYADIAYARAVDAAGGLAVHLPMQSDPAALADRIDGLLLPGGDDFAPEHDYPDGVAFDLADESQVAFDSALLQAALERSLPVLGICYGAQLIALAHGGTLHHHIPTDLPDALEHRLPEASGRHPIDVVAGSRLARIFAESGDGEAGAGDGGDRGRGASGGSDGSEGTSEVNSLHHQAVATLGDGLRATAHAPDGLIEGFEAPGESYLVGVQWHPEKLDDAVSERLFSDFVAACRSVAPRG